jgi:hypothetical protein
MAIEISKADVARAEALLEALLTEQVPEGRFTKGSALRDLTVKALSFAFAYQQKENATVKSLQSLLTVQQIQTTDPDLDRSVSQATDAILSNWFINRNMGIFARGMIFIQVTKRQDYIVPGNYRFMYDRTRVFYPDVIDGTQNVVIRSDELLPVIGVDGIVNGYQFSLRVIAARTGADYNVEPGIWQDGATFSAYATRVLSSTKFENGKGRESTQDLIARSGTAITVRNLINTRSIEATLREKFGLTGRMLVTGMGDPEMQRDRKVDLSAQSALHVGGHFDVFMELPRVQETFEGVIGGKFVRPDGIINVFRDPEIADWTTAILSHQNTLVSIKPGDVLRVSGGLAEAPRDFVIKEVYASELRVGISTPFSVPTDESTKYISYYIYRPLQGSDFQILPSTGVRVTGQTSRQVSTPGCVVLPGNARYDILDVAVINPDVNDPLANTSTGFVHFPLRSNEPPLISEYQLVSRRPELAQSLLAYEEIHVQGYAGKTLRVTYETLATLPALHSYTQNRFERIMAGNILTRGYFPVYLSLAVPYKLKPTATSAIDEAGLCAAIVNSINSFDPHDIISVSDITTTVQGYDSRIGTVFPFTIEYTVHLPDGRQLAFSTEDEVVMHTEEIVTAIGDPLRFSLSDRTVRYFTTLSRVSVYLGS